MCNNVSRRCDRCGVSNPSLGEWDNYCDPCLAYFRDLDDAEENERLRKEYIESFEVREDSEYHFGGPNRG